MNGDERARLVERIVATWPNGPRGFVWTTVLAELDGDLATAAYERLVRELEHGYPTTGKFLATYWACRRPDYGPTRPEDTGPVVSMADYLARHPTGELADWRARHPSSSSTSTP